MKKDRRYKRKGLAKTVRVQDMTLNIPWCEFV